MRAIALYNLKGGVGKTAAAVNLASVAAGEGGRVLLWDLDAQAAATWYLRGEATGETSAKRLWSGRNALASRIQATAWENLDLVPSEEGYRDSDQRLGKQESDDALAEQLASLSDDYDWVFLDCPPSLSSLAEQVFRACDLVVMPLVPTWLSLRAFEQVRARVAELDLPEERLAPFFSMVDSRRSLHQQWLYHPPVELARRLRSFVPYSSTVERMGERQAPLVSYAAADAAARAYHRLWAEISRRLSRTR